jgi:hypothetical protein
MTFYFKNIPPKEMKASAPASSTLCSHESRIFYDDSGKHPFAQGFVIAVLLTVQIILTVVSQNVWYNGLRTGPTLPGTGCAKEA